MYCSLFQSRYCLLLLQLVLHQGLKLSLPWAEACGELMSYKQTIDSLFAITDSLIALSTKHVQTDICFILKLNHIRWLLARSTTSEESGKLFRWSNSHFLPPILNIFLEHWDFFIQLSQFDLFIAPKRAMTTFFLQNRWRSQSLRVVC